MLVEEGGGWGGGQTGTLKVCLLLLNQTFQCIAIPNDSKFLGEKVHIKKFILNFLIEINT